MKTLIFLILTILPISKISAQKAYWGLNINSYLLFEKGTNSNSKILPPPDLDIHIGNSLNNNLAAEIYAGYITFADSWNGPDIGLAFKYKALNNLSGFFGIEYNHVKGGSNLPGNHTPFYYKKDFTFLNLGVDYLLTKILFVELNYSYPLNSNTDYGTGSLVYQDQSVEKFKLTSRLKLGFGFNFSF